MLAPSSERLKKYCTDAGCYTGASQDPPALQLYLSASNAAIPSHPFLQSLFRRILKSPNLRTLLSARLNAKATNQQHGGEPRMRRTWIRCDIVPLIVIPISVPIPRFARPREEHKRLPSAGHGSGRSVAGREGLSHGLGLVRRHSGQ